VIQGCVELLFVATCQQTYGKLFLMRIVEQECHAKVVAHAPLFWFLLWVTDWEKFNSLFHPSVILLQHLGIDTEWLVVVIELN